MGEREMTRYAFISHMEAFMKKLLTEPLKADTDEFLKSFGIGSKEAIKLLMDGGIVERSEKIKNGGTDKSGKRLPDTFTIKYRIPRKDYTKKMRNLYINEFEKNEIEDSPLNKEKEVDEATAGACAGAYSAPLFGQPIRRKLYITSEQAEYLKKVLSEEVGSMDMGYDAPFGNKKGNKGNDFFKDANNHKGIIASGIPENN